MAPGIEQADISTEIARGIPVGHSRITERRRRDQVGVLKAGNPIAVPHLLRAQGCLLHAGKRSIVGTKIRSGLLTIVLAAFNEWRVLAKRWLWLLRIDLGRTGEKSSRHCNS